MTLWLPVQCVVLVGAWWIAVKAVHRTHLLGSWGGGDLPRVVERLVRSGRASELPSLASELEPSAVCELLRSPEVQARDQDALALHAQEVLTSLRPEERLLRGLATIGTSLGLLAAIVTMRGALGLSETASAERAVVGAMDSAVLGFMTGFPCWTAIALARRRLRAAAAELDRLVEVMIPRGSGPGRRGETTEVI